MQLKKIVIIGPECTGKSILCKQLADHYNTAWVPEYAREYLINNGKEYRYEDLYKIGEGQIREEEITVKSIEQNYRIERIQNPSSNPSGQPIFIDTDLYVIKVWSEFVFNKCDNRILSQIADRHYDLYLLCNIDLPWVKDELREHPDLYSRQKLSHYYKDALINQSVPWVEISGNYEQRLQKAINAVESIL